MNQNLRIQSLELLINKRGSFNSKRFSLLSDDHPVKVFFNSDQFQSCNSLNEIFYRIKHNLDCAPECPTCGNSVKFEKSTSHYHKFCSCRCAQLDSEVRIKNQNTNMIRYGVSNGALSEQSKLKYKQTSLRKFGSENFFSSDLGKEKIKQSCMRKFGVENPHQSKEVKEKFKRTCISRFGVEYPHQNRLIRLKSQQKYRYQNYNFDSGLELIYFIYLKDHNISFEYQPDISFDYIVDNEIHKYFPDFCVNGILTEIKGDHFFDGDKMINPYDRSLDNRYELKHQCMIRNNVTILKESDMKDIISYVYKTYGNTYIKQFKHTGNEIKE